MSFSLTPGQWGDAPAGRDLLRTLPSPEEPVALIMDRAYEGDETRQLAFALGFTPVVPPKQNRLVPWSFNEQLYRRHNEIERRMISLNPLGVLVDYYDLEFERPISEAGTIGLGGTLDPDGDLVGDGEEEYLNVDLILRFYPSGRLMHGWAFGAKVGVTRLDGATTSGFGFDVNRSWLLGANENFYVGGGFGLKRLLGAAAGRRFLPTFRLVNVGFAF